MLNLKTFEELFLLDEKKNQTYDYGVLMLKTPNFSKNFGIKIDSEDLHENGIEDEPHITILYGFECDKFHENKLCEIISKSLSNKKEIEYKLEGLGMFENDEYDVLHFEIKSEDLNNMFKSVSKLPNQNEYPDYKAHSTIGYVKKGKGKKYLEKYKDLDIKKEIYKGNRLVYSRPNKWFSKMKTDIDLKKMI